MQLVDLNGRYGTISVVKNNIKRAVRTSLRRDVAAVIADKHTAEPCTGHLHHRRKEIHCTMKDTR